MRPSSTASRRWGGSPMMLADSGSDFMFEKANWLFDLSYVLFARFPPTRAFSKWFTHRLGTRGLVAADRRVAPRRDRLDLPGRHRGARVPARARTDRRSRRLGDHRSRRAAVLGAPGRRPAPDHRARVRWTSCAGSHPARGVVCVRGLTSPALRAAGRRGGARAATSRCRRTAPLIVVSGGGWAVGDLGGAAQARSTPIRARRCSCSAGAATTVRAALERPLRRRAAAAHARLHRSDGRRARRRGRADPLDRRPDGVRGAAARLPRHLLRLGRRRTSASTTRPTSASGSARVVDRRRRPARRAARRARRAARPRTRPTRGGRRRPARCSALIGARGVSARRAVLGGRARRGRGVGGSRRSRRSCRRWPARCASRCADPAPPASR